MADLKKEDGYILVVVIGILTILSLMTITFATLSRIETRATRNYADSVKCEMVAKAALEHALYIIRQDKFGDDDVAYNNDNTDTNYDYYDPSGDASWPGDGIFDGTDYDNDKDGVSIPPEDSKWIYFPATTSSLDIRLPGKLRARYAVLITDDREARVNINVSGNQPGDEGTSTFEIDMSSVITPDGNSIASDIISERTTTMPFGVLTEAEIVGIVGTSTAYTSRLEEIFENYTAAYEDYKGTLTAFSADTIVCPSYTLGTSTATTMLNVNALIYNEGAYTDTDIYDTNKKVSMIVDVLTKGGVPDVERQQLAVNIVDFIDDTPVDPIGTVTTYVDGDTYYGVEKTPYINEVEAWPSGTNPEFIELYNPYDENLPTTGGWTIRLDAGTTIIALPAASVPASGYYVIGDSVAAGVDQVDANIANLDSGGEELRLRDNNGIDVQVTNYGSANQDDTCSLNDPRPIPLTATAADPWSWTTNSSNTIGAQNSNFDPTVGDDGWTGATQANSFFMANSRFPNKGYLGYIHRGSEWSSFKIDNSSANQNVLHYITITDPSMDGIDNDGDGATDSLDTGVQAGDIDGKEYRIPGLINVNTASEEVLKSLPVIGTMTAATDIANGIKPYDSINDLLVKITSITDTSATNNKWNREKRFRAISNLITTRSNVFTVYVTAQIIDEAISSVYAEKRILAIVDRSVDPIRIRYFRWIVE